MTTQNSTLGLLVEASEVEKATAHLKAMGDAAKAAASDVTALGDKSSKAGGKVASAVDGLRATATAARETSTEFSLVPKRMDVFKNALTGTATASFATAAAMGATTSAAATQAEVVGRSSAGIKASLQAPASGFTTVGAAAAAASPKVGDFAKQTQNYTMSAKAQAAAMRGVPAQFTDIITSLQGGQRPLTVLLQQGGQLKDMFGGIGPAVRALGSYVLGLVSPFTVAAAAAALIGVAFYEGAAEAKAYNVAISATGNYVGQTSLQMQEAAARVGKLTTTHSAAAEVLAMLAGTGKIAGDQLELVGRAIVATNDATGKSVQDLVKEFTSLADNPVRASEQLNSSMHYLSEGTEEAIRKMEQHGDKTGAAATAMEAYANALIPRAQTVKSQAGVMERAWDAAFLAVKKYWDEVKGIGRTSAAGDASGSSLFSSEGFDSVETAAQTRARLAARKSKASGGFGSIPEDDEPKQSITQRLGKAWDFVKYGATAMKVATSHTVGEVTGINKQIEAEQKDQKTATQREEAARIQAKADAENAKAREKRSAANANIAAREKANATKAQQRAEARATIDRDFAALPDTPENKALKLKQYKDSDEKLKDPKASEGGGRKPRAEPKNNRLKNFTENIDRDIATFGQSEDERKIIDLRNMGASTAQLDEYSGKLRTLQGLKDKQIRSAYEEEKALQSVKEAQKDSTEVYEENLRQLQNSLKAKTISEIEYDTQISALRKKRADDLETMAQREREIITAHGIGDQTEQQRIETEKQLEKVTKDLTSARRDLNAEMSKEVDDKWMERQERINSLTESMLTPMERYNKELKELNELRAQGGDAFAPTFQKAQNEAYRKLLEGTEAVNGSLGTMTDLAIMAGRGIQNNLGAATAAIVKGDLKSIGTSFASTVESMAAKLIETNLSRLFFGDTGKLGGGGGMFDSILSSIGGGGGGGGGFWSGIGSFISSLFSFDGGGKTPDGPRSGGLDGKGGFIAMLHPQETVTDHTKDGGNGGQKMTFKMLNGGTQPAGQSIASTVVVNLINNGAPVKEESRKQRSDGNGGSIVDIFLAAAANDVRSGGGLADAMQGTYGLNRSAGAMT